MKFAQSIQTAPVFFCHNIKKQQTIKESQLQRRGREQTLKAATHRWKHKCVKKKEGNEEAFDVQISFNPRIANW